MEENITEIQKENIEEKTQNVQDVQDVSEEVKTQETASIPDFLNDFLDARSASAKIKILDEHSEELDEKMVGIIEASLDLPGGSGTLFQRIEYVHYYLRTRRRFETDRLR